MPISNRYTNHIISNKWNTNKNYIRLHDHVLCPGIFIRETRSLKLTCEFQFCGMNVKKIPNDHCSQQNSAFEASTTTRRLLRKNPFFCLSNWKLGFSERTSRFNSSSAAENGNRSGNHGQIYKAKYAAERWRAGDRLTREDCISQRVEI